MRHLITQVHRGLNWLILSGLVLQFFLAGVGIFGAASMEAHGISGTLIGLLALVNVVIVLAARPGGGAIGRTLAFMGLVLLQFALVFLMEVSPWIAAFHPVNAIALLYVGQMQVRAKFPALSQEPKTATMRSTKPSAA